MIQKNIRDYNNQEYSKEEGAEIIKELDDRTKSALVGYNSIGEVGAKTKELTESFEVLNTEGIKSYPLVSDLPDATGLADGVSARVYDESVNTNNGIYRVTSESWVNTQPLANGVIEKGDVQSVSGDTVFDAIKDNIIYVTGKNIFNKSRVTANYYMTNVGNILSNASYSFSDYISVIPLQQYVSNYQLRYTCFFDENKNVVVGGSSATTTTFTPPAGAVFVVTTIFNSINIDLYQIEQGVAFTEFEEYKQNVPFEKIELGEVLPTNSTLPVVGEKVYSHVLKSFLPLFSLAKSLNFTSANTPQWNYESSTFSAWGSGVGVRSAFKAITLKIRSWDVANPITQIRVRVKENDKDGNILGDKLLSFSTVDDYDEITFYFDDIIDNPNPLWVEYFTDGKIGLYGNPTNTDIGQGATSNRYAITQDIDGIIGGEVSINKTAPMWVGFYTVNDSLIELTPQGIIDLETKLGINGFVPRINLPDSIDAVVGYTQQLFFRGMIEAIDPYQWNIKVTGDVGGKQFPRYYEFTPSGAGAQTFTISLYNDKDALIATASTTINVVASMSNPASTEKVLCVGDSITVAGDWTAEFLRMLTASGGVPVGLNLSNFEFIGTQGSGTNKHEGHSGKTWNWFINSSSPFWNASAIDFANYVATNGYGAINHLLILLTWNGMTGGLKDASNHSTLITHAKVFLDQFHLDYPTARVKLMSIPLPSLNGGLGDDYGDATSNYGNYHSLVQTVFGLNLAYQDLANEAGYSAWVDFVNISAQFDNENNMPEADVAVNLRSAITEKLGTNGVHPKTEGYYQISDAIFKAFNN